jgi:hypothetical protein
MTPTHSTGKYSECGQGWTNSLTTNVGADLPVGIRPSTIDTVLKVSITLNLTIMFKNLIANAGQASFEEEPQPLLIWRRPRYGNRSHFTNRYRVSGN